MGRTAASTRSSRAYVRGVMKTLMTYRLHCVFCGYDADRDAPSRRCPRCHGTLFLELDLEPGPRPAPSPRATRLVVVGRRSPDMAKAS